MQVLVLLAVGTATMTGVEVVLHAQRVEARDRIEQVAAHVRRKSLEAVSHARTAMEAIAREQQRLEDATRKAAASKAARQAVGGSTPESPDQAVGREEAMEQVMDALRMGTTVQLVTFTNPSGKMLGIRKAPANGPVSRTLRGTASYEADIVDKDTATVAGRLRAQYAVKSAEEVVRRAAQVPGGGIGHAFAWTGNDRWIMAQHTSDGGESGLLDVRTDMGRIHKAKAEGARTGTATSKGAHVAWASNSADTADAQAITVVLYRMGGDGASAGRTLEEVQTGLGRQAWPIRTGLGILLAAALAMVLTGRSPAKTERKE